MACKLILLQLHAFTSEFPLFKQLNEDIREDLKKDFLEMQLSDSSAAGLKPYEFHYDCVHFFLTRK